MDEGRGHRAAHAAMASSLDGCRVGKLYESALEKRMSRDRHAFREAEGPRHAECRPAMLHALFICSRNRLRSPTAAQVFATVEGVTTDSAGLAADAECPLDPEQLAWADVIFVMEKVHRSRLSQRFGRHLKGRKVICLDIPDDYEFMAPELVTLLERKVTPHLLALGRSRS